MVEQLAQLEGERRMEQALQKTWAGKTRRMGGTRCEGAAWIYIYGMKAQLLESLWVRNREEAGKADTERVLLQTPW